MNTPVVDLNDLPSGIYRPPSGTSEILFPPPGTRYYKMTGRSRTNGEWLVVHTGEHGLTTYQYIEPMLTGTINYPKEGQ